VANECPVCVQRKSKRKCLVHGMICTPCCGKVREKGSCPDHCPHLVKARKFSLARDIEKAKKSNEPLLTHFSLNSQRLMPVVEEIENQLQQKSSTDPYLTDGQVLEGVIRAQRYFSSRDDVDRAEVLLNRVGIIESMMKDVVLLNNNSRDPISNHDIEAILESLITHLRKVMLDDDGKNSYVDGLRTNDNLNKQPQDEPLIII
jgi:hypothetical protein